MVCASVFMGFPVLGKMYSIIFEFLGNWGFWWADMWTLNPNM
jgi:hypothetical protein